MSQIDRPKPLLRAATIDAMEPVRSQHQFNDNAVRLTRTLGTRVMAGERHANDVVHYPRIRRSMIKSPARRRWIDWDDLHEL
jgi:hypothetical protein